MSDLFENFQGRRGRSHQVAVDFKKEVELGSEGSKGRANVKMLLDGEAIDVGEMFIKYSRSPESVLEVYNILRGVFTKAIEEGEMDYLPLPPTLRIKDIRILMTDMTRNGKNVVIDRHYSDAIEENEIPWEFTLKNKEENLELVEKVYEIASRAGIYLSYDAYSVVADRETGFGRVFLIDLGHVAPYTGKSLRGFGEEDVKRIGINNKNKFKDFINNLEEERYL